jgi:hypothetical protein
VANIPITRSCQTVDVILDDGTKWTGVGPAVPGFFEQADMAIMPIRTVVVHEPKAMPDDCSWAIMEEDDDH